MAVAVLFGEQESTEQVNCIVSSMHQTTNFPTTRRIAGSSPSYLGQHPMVLVLSRGGFCPKDRRQAEGDIFC